MESGTSSEKSIKSDILKVENLFWAVITALVLALVYIFRDTYGVVGLVVGLLALIAIYLGYRNYKLKEDIKELGSDAVSKSEVRNIYLKQLLDPNTICGHVIILQEGFNKPMIYSSEFKKGQQIEIIAFANQGFNFAILNSDEYDEILTNPMEITHISLTQYLRLNFEIEPKTSYNHAPSFKTRYEIPEEGEYYLLFCRSHESKKGKVEISFLLSELSSIPKSKEKKIPVNSKP